MCIANCSRTLHIEIKINREEIRIMISWVVVPCSMLDGNISEKSAASFSKVELKKRIIQNVGTYHRTGYHILEHRYLYTQRHENFRSKRDDRNIKKNSEERGKDWLPAFIQCITTGAVEN
jgi:hypothetical protein